MSAEVGENAIDIALKVARALTTVGAEYFVGGSLASSLQGEPRATNGIDFVIALPLGKIGELAAALGGDFEVDIDTLREALRRASCANAFRLKRDIRRATRGSRRIAAFRQEHGTTPRSSWENLESRSATLPPWTLRPGSAPSAASSERLNGPCAASTWDTSRFGTLWTALPSTSESP
jgi:hypothetical protein